MAGWNSAGLRARGAGAHAAEFWAGVSVYPINVAAFAYVPKEKTNMGTRESSIWRGTSGRAWDATSRTMLTPPHSFIKRG